MDANAADGHYTHAYISSPAKTNHWTIEPSANVVMLTIWLSLINLFLLIAEHHSLPILLESSTYLAPYSGKLSTLYSWLFSPVAKALTILGALLVLKSRVFAFWVYLAASLLFVGKWVIIGFAWSAMFIPTNNITSLYAQLFIDASILLVMMGITIHLYRIWYRSR